MVDEIIIIKNNMSIILSQKDNNHIAQLTNSPGIWGIGRNEKEAIEDLVLAIHRFKL